MELYEKIKKAAKHDGLVGIYGLGIWGQGFAWRLFSYLNVSIDFVSDCNTDKLNQFYQNHIRKITLDELLNIQSETIVFVMIGQFYIKEAIKKLAQNPNLILIALDEVLNLDCVLEQFYGVENIRQFEKKSFMCLKEKKSSNKYFKKKDRIAVYTCIINGYDELKEPLIIEENCDYFLISDKEPSESKVFQWMDYKTVVPEEYKNPAVINRYCKMYAYKIFPDYRYSIYMDGKVQIIKKISHYIYNVGKIGIGLHKHILDCIYVEGIRMVGVGTSNEYDVIQQMKEYLLEGMPRNFGSFECRVVVRDHNSIIGNQLMKQWFDEYCHKEKRDQFSLSYILWKNGLTCNDVGLINNGLPWAENSDIECRTKHLKGIAEQNDTNFIRMN